MRILQVIETGGPGGAETVFARLSGGLQSRGHQVNCLVRNGSWLPKELTKRGLPFVLMPSGSAFDWPLLQLLRHQIRSQNAQIVHAHLFEGALYAALAARLEGIPCIVTLHGQVDVRRGGIKAAIKQRLFRASITRVVAVSDMLRTELRDALQIAPANFSVVPNGVPLPDAAQVPEARSVSASPRIIAIGNIRKAKDYPTLIQAMSLLRDQIPDVLLNVLGQPDREGLYEVLLAQVQELRLESHVTFHGFVADPQSMLREADCFVLSSSQEGFSLSTIEAMLAGIPVVATRSGGPEEILEHEVTGLLVPVRDAAAMAQALTRLLQDKNGVRESLTNRAFHVARERYSEAAMVSAYESLYASLLPTPPDRGP